MSKITFRADDDLVERVEALDASKSEVMREALRSYLERRGSPDAELEVVDELVAEHVDRALAARREEADDARDVNVNVTVEHEGLARTSEDADAVPSRPSRPGREAAGHGAAGQGTTGRTNGGAGAPGDGGAEGERSCARCGEELADGHVYCPNCGEKASRRLFCECGDELRSDWAYCPGCGRPTPSAEVLDG